MDPWTAAGYVAGAALVLLLARGLWILKRSGDARIERKKTLVKAKEGRNPEDAMTYDQEIEAKAIGYLKKVPLVRRALRWF